MKKYFKFLIFGILPTLAFSIDEIGKKSKHFEDWVYSVEPPTIEYYHETLEHYDLETLKKDDSLRFLWVRLHHPAMLFEELNDNPTVTLKVSVFDDLKLEWREYKRIEYSKDDHLAVLKNIKEGFGFFSMPFSTSRKGDGGADWFIEAKIDGQHHTVYRWSPDSNTSFYTLGFMFIESAIGKPLAPIY